MNKEVLQNIIDGCKKNDRISQKQLYDLFSEKLYATALSYTANKEDAQDILHDSFIKIFTYLQKKDKDIEIKGLLAWMKRIVINTALDFLRRKKRITYTDEINEREPQSSISIKDLQNVKDITMLLQSIPTGARTVFNLYAVEGYSHKEIAQLLKVSESTSKSQYHRAKKLLQEFVTKYYQRD
jgi:RNA polymerase sigma-70 factor (ECF subfamily)